MKNTQILIVEDEANLARTLAQALRMGSNGGYLVDTVENAEDALEKLDGEKYDVVISDLHLPGIDGLEFIAKTKQNFPDMHFILMTGFGSNTVEDQATQLTDGYLTKPFDMLDLLIMVRQVIDTSSQMNGKALTSADLKKGAEFRRILIMEDDLGLQRIYNKALGKSNYTLDIASTLSEARELIQTKEYEVFICDIHMGRERGTDLLIEQRELLNKNGTQVVMVSAYGQYRTLVEDMGADFFLEKPISLGTLLTLVSRLMNEAKEKVH